MRLYEPAWNAAGPRTGASDQIFSQSDGATLLSVTQEGDAYMATFPIAVQLT